MARRSSPIEQLDQAVEAMMVHPDAPPARITPSLAALLRIAADLRDLPSQTFKARLKAELTSPPSPEPPAGKSKAAPLRYHSATPYLMVRDAAGAIDFYKKAFGATEQTERLTDPTGQIMHAEIEIGDSPIMIAEEAPQWGNLSPQSLGGSPVIINLHVDDVDATASRAIAAGARVIFPVADQFYGERSGRLADPFGHIWIVATHREDVSPAEIRRRAQAYSRQQEEATMVEPIRKGFHSITPYLQVEGAARMVDFLRQAFGAEEVFRTTRTDGRITHAELRIEGSMVELADATADYKPNPTAIWLFVDDADAVYERALKAGAASLHEPVDQDYGDREASVRDPFGNHWYIATHRPDAEPLPEELRSVTPYLHPKGAPKLIDFLKKAFDANEVFRAQDPAGTVHHAKVRIGDSMIAMGEAHGPYQPMPPALHLYVRDTDEVYRRALQAGASSLSEPADQPYGDRSAGVKDPFGNVWYIATHTKDVAASKTREEAPTQVGSVSESSRGVMPFLYIKDAPAALEFYQKVLGATELMREVGPGGTVTHVQMQAGEAKFMIRDPSVGMPAEYIEKGLSRTALELGGTPVHLYLYVKNVNEVFKRALDAGAKVVDALEDKEWGDRCGGFQDPFGQIWYVATPAKDARQ